MAQLPQLNDSQNNLLAKIADNTGESKPRVGDGQHNLLFKIAQNTYAGAGLLATSLQQSGSGYVIVQQGDDLAAKYAEAKAKNPSATNRISVFIVPGTYSLSSELEIDAEYVDLVGLGAQFQSPAVIVSNNTLNVTANDVRVSGISVGAQQFKIADNKPLQVFENCSGGDNSFGGGGTASGTFVGCVGGDDSFGGYDITQSSTSSFNGCVAGEDGFGGNAGEYPSGKYISCRLTTGTFPTIYIPGRARFCLDGDYDIVNADGGYDSDVESFITTAGVTDDTAKDQLNLFVIGIKRLGLWDDMVCWPLRSAQNAGTGSTAYSLGGLGTYNGTLVNGPTWGVDGLTLLGSSSQYVDIGDATALRMQNEVGLALVFSTASASNFNSNFGCLFGKTPGGAGQNHNYQWNERQNERNVAFATGDGVSSVVNVNVAIGANTDKQFLLGSAKTGDVSKVKHNNNAIASTANALTQFNTTADTLKINRGGVSNADGGEFAFTALFSTSLADSEMNSLYSIYKSTLGQGLGLP